MELLHYLIIFGLISAITSDKDILNDTSELGRLLKDNMFLNPAVIKNAPGVYAQLRDGFKVITNPVIGNEPEKIDVLENMVVKGPDSITRLLNRKSTATDAKEQ